MKTCFKALLFLLIIIYIDAKPKARKGFCFERHSAKRGCRTIKIVKGGRKTTLDECCRNGGLGWSLKSRDRKTCTTCKSIVSEAKPKNRKGVCFDRYSPKSGCRKFTLVNDEKTSTIEECCRSGGEGWSIKKKDRKNCTSCQTVDTSFWGEWSKWTKCSATCGHALMTRKRKCISNGKPSCRGRNIHSKQCKNLPHCPIDGGWSDWSPWGPCSKTCKKGTKIRRRACADPKPQYGGKECKGSLEDWVDCERKPNCPIDGGWGEWGPWGLCSKTCDLGTKMRTRKCTNPPPKYDGKPCVAKQGNGMDYCLEERCNPGRTPCDDRNEECASGSGSKWDHNSGSGSGDGFSGSGFSSGFGSGSGEGIDGGSGGGFHRRSHKRKPKISDDEDLR